jgi:hypothetical protein
MLATAIGEEDERYVVVLQMPKRFRGTGNGLGNMKQNTIDTVVILDLVSIMAELKKVQIGGRL